MASNPRSLVLTLLGCAGLARADIILVDDSFTDGDRSSSAPPTSLAWTVGSHHATAAASAVGTLDASGGNLLWDHSAPAATASFSGIWGHFTSSAAPLTLSLGEKLTLSFDVRFENNSLSSSANALRWALFDSNASRVASDFAGSNLPGLSSGAAFSPWRGYAGQSTVSGAAVAGDNLFVRERVGGGSGLFASTEYTDVAGTITAEPLFALNTTYNGLLELELTAAGMLARAGINGVFTPIGLDATPQVQFDTISFFATDSLSADLRLDNVRLTLVPESSTGLLLCAGLAALRLRRRST